MSDEGWSDDEFWDRVVALGEEIEKSEWCFVQGDLYEDKRLER